MSGKAIGTRMHWLCGTRGALTLAPLHFVPAFAGPTIDVAPMLIAFHYRAT
jgi:hypothetical protein